MINAYLVPIVYSYAKGTDKLNCSFSTAENTHLLRQVKYHNMADVLLYMYVKVSLYKVAQTEPKKCWYIYDLLPMT